MNIMLLGCTVTFGDKTHRADVQWGITRPRPDDRWAAYSIDVSTVVALLRDVVDGRGTPAGALDALESGLGALFAQSGCCPRCEGSIQRYAEALARYEARMAAEQARAVGMTGETHPFNVTVSNAIHMFDCRHAGDVTIPHPGQTLQEYVHGLEEDEYRYHNGEEPYARRMTPEELVVWLRDKTGPKGGELFRRCKVCQPALPVAYRSEACDVE